MSFAEPIQLTDLSSGVCIVAPAGDAYQAAAEKLKSALATDIDVLPAGESDINGHHVIALGNMMDSGFLRTLYCRAYDLTDRAWPGPGGWVIRTAPHTLSDAGHVIVVGVSQAEDAGDAAQALAREIETNGPTLPCQYRVELGRWADLYLKPAQDRLGKGDASLERDHTDGAGDWSYMSAIAEIGMLAVQTGLPELMTMFCRQVCHFGRTRWFERHLPDPPQIHGFVRTMLLPFTILENHPAIPRDLRKEALDTFLGIYRSTEGAGNPGFLNCVGLDRVRQNHQTMSGLDLYYGGRYFHQVHGLAEGLAWMKLAEVFFAPQMASNKPVCDSWGHQWACSLFNTADFALASGKMDYFSSKPFLEGVDRALIAHSNLEDGPLQYFLMAAAVTGNAEYLWLCRASDEDELVKRAVRIRTEPLRTWVTGQPASEPLRLGRMNVAPLSRLFYDSIEDQAGWAPKGMYLRNVPFERTFDKVFFRSGWSDEDDYLLLDGISGGSHSYQDANCIVRYTSRGENWFGGRVGFGPASVREHVGVGIAVDGAGPGCESRYATLRYSQEGEHFSVVGTAMIYPEQGDWIRHIIHGRDGWFLVVDEIWPYRDGEFLVEARWHVFGEATLTEGTLQSTQGNARLTMQHVGSAVQDLVPAVYASAKGGNRWIQRSLKALRPGEGIRFATLFWADRTGSVRDFALSAEESGYRVNAEGASVEVMLVGDRDTPEVGASEVVLPTAAGSVSDASVSELFHLPRAEVSPVWSSTCHGKPTCIAVWRDGCCVGDEQGGITALNREGNTLWRSDVAGPARCVTALADGGIVVGGGDEKVYRLDRAGKLLWGHQLQWQPMVWDYWTRLNCEIVSLAAGDINRDGDEEILVGCADRHVYAFDDAGNLLWRSACQWGPPTCLGLARMDDTDATFVLAGMADPAIHGCVRVFSPDGACVQTLQRPDIMSWSVPSWMKCLRTADLDGDGWDEIICGLDTNHRQLLVYRRDGTIAWQADLGAAVTAVEVAHGRVFAGAANGYVQCFAPDGERAYCTFLVQPIMGLAPLSNGTCIAALRDGQVVLLDESGSPAGSRAGAPAACTAYASAWSDAVLLVGRRDSTLEAYGQASS